MPKEKSPLRILQREGDTLKKEIDAYMEECGLVLDDSSLKDRTSRMKKLFDRSGTLRKKCKALEKKLLNLSKGKEPTVIPNFEEMRAEEVERMHALEVRLEKIGSKLEPDEVEESYFNSVKEKDEPLKKQGSKPPAGEIDDDSDDDDDEDDDEEEEVDSEEEEDGEEETKMDTTNPEEENEGDGDKEDDGKKAKFKRLSVFRRSKSESKVEKIDADTEKEKKDKDKDKKDKKEKDKKGKEKSEKEKEKEKEKERKEQEKKEKKEKEKQEKERKEKEKKEQKEREQEEKRKKKEKELAAKSAKSKKGEDGDSKKDKDEEKRPDSPSKRSFGAKLFSRDSKKPKIEETKKEQSESEDDEDEEDDVEGEEEDEDMEEEEEGEEEELEDGEEEEEEEEEEEDDDDDEEEEEDVEDDDEEKEQKKVEPKQEKKKGWSLFRRDKSPQRQIKKDNEKDSKKKKEDKKQVRVQEEEEDEEEEQEEDEDEDDEEEEEEEEEEESDDDQGVIKGKKAQRVESEEEEEESEEDEEEEEEEEELEDGEESEEVFEEESEEEDNFKPPDEGMDLFEAVCDFDGEEDDDLNFKRGAVLTILNVREDGWWMAEDEEGNKGLVPSTYLKLKKEHNDFRDVQSPDVDEPAQSVSPRSGKELWRGLRKSVTETGVTDVLTAMGAIPAGFRPSTTARHLRTEAYTLSNFLKPRFTESCLGFQDLNWSPHENQIRAKTVRLQKILTILMVRNMPACGVGIEIKSRHVRICFFDGDKILSNIHTIQATWNKNDPKTWRFSPKVTALLPSILDGDCFIRSSHTEENIGLLFELCLSYVRPKTGEKGELSCGWVFQPLYDTATGAPIVNKMYEFQVQGGTPYEQDVEVDPSISRRTSSSKFRSMMSANKQPRLQIKFITPTKEQKPLLDMLPETIVSSLSYLPFLSMFRNLQAVEVLRDRIDLQNADLIHCPVLANFPEATKYPDIMDALRSCWADKKLKNKKIDKKDPEQMKELFSSTFMDSVYPIMRLPSLPPYKWGDEERDNERWQVISEFLQSNKQKGILASFLAPGVEHTPFDMTEVAFNLLDSFQELK